MLYKTIFILHIMDIFTSQIFDLNNTIAQQIGMEIFIKIKSLKSVTYSSVVIEQEDYSLHMRTLYFWHHVHYTSLFAT